VSDQSGADNPDCDGTLVDTYFDAALCVNGVPRVLVVDYQLVFTTADAEVPEWDAVSVLVNSTDYGVGAPPGTGGGLAAATLSAGNAGALHELGHAAFGLADEYEYFAGCNSGETTQDTYNGAEPLEPNVTAATTLGTLKWAGHVDPATQVPTTQNTDCGRCDDQPSPVAPGTVGLFEGAGYFHCGLYRPEFDCRRRRAAPARADGALMARVTAEQVERLRRFADEEAARTARGRHWLQLLRSHQQELLARYAASPALRAHIDQALGQAAALVESLETDRPRVVDDDAVATVDAVLTELDTRASPDLRQATETLRRDLQAARGGTIREALGPRDP
jgi:hypothetical protein